MRNRCRSRPAPAATVPHQRGAGESGHQVGGLHGKRRHWHRPSKAPVAGLDRLSGNRGAQKQDVTRQPRAMPKAQLSRTRAGHPSRIRVSVCASARDRRSASSTSSPPRIASRASGRAALRLPNRPAPAETDPPPPAGRAAGHPPRHRRHGRRRVGRGQELAHLRPIRSFASRSIPSASSAEAASPSASMPSSGSHTRRESGRNAGCAGNPRGSGHGDRR
jgi:hypothetical protein